MQTKENRFRASQQDFNCWDLAENAEEYKGSRFGAGYLIVLCGQYILFYSLRSKFACMCMNELFEYNEGGCVQKTVEL